MKMEYIERKYLVIKNLNFSSGIPEKFFIHEYKKGKERLGKREAVVENMVLQ